MVADVQRRAAGDGGAAGVGPQHVHVVPLPVRGAVPRVGGLRVRGRRVAGGAGVPGRRRRTAPRRHLSAPCQYPIFANLHTINCFRYKIGNVIMMTNLVLLLRNKDKYRKQNDVGMT